MNKMNDKIVYTPGPSEVRENVRLMRAEKTTNPDVDLDFCEFYKNTCDKMAQILKTNFSNFYVCNIGPVNDFVNMVKEKWGYAVGQSIYVSILFILHIAFLMFSYKVFKFIETIKSKITHQNSKQIKE